LEENTPDSARGVRASKGKSCIDDKRIAKRADLITGTKWKKKREKKGKKADANKNRVCPMGKRTCRAPRSTLPKGKEFCVKMKNVLGCGEKKKKDDNQRSRWGG